MLASSASHPFDTHTFVKGLTNAGMPEPQAEVIVRTLCDEQWRALEGRFVTRDVLSAEMAMLLHEFSAFRNDMKEMRAAAQADNQALKNDIQSARAEAKADNQELKNEIQSARTEAKTENQQTRNDFKNDTLKVSSDLKLEIQGVRSEVRETRAELTVIKWVGGFMIAAIMAAQFKNVFGF
jgi:isoleucyl-tRNA synthetase